VGDEILLGELIWTGMLGLWCVDDPHLTGWLPDSILRETA